MTDDIVKRLRERPNRRAYESDNEAKERRQMERVEAADKIERLLEEIQQLKHDSTIFINERSDAICENFDFREENAELREKIERLRAALREIALFSPYKHSSTLRRKARAALEEEKKNDPV